MNSGSFGVMAEHHITSHHPLQLPSSPGIQLCSTLAGARTGILSCMDSPASFEGGYVHRGTWGRGQRMTALTGLRWVGQRVVAHEWGALGTASAVFSHNEGGTRFHGLQFKAKGLEALNHKVEALTIRWPTSSWAAPPYDMLMQQTGCLLCICRQMAYDYLLIVTALIGHWRSMGQLIQSKYKKIKHCSIK